MFNEQSEEYPLTTPTMKMEIENATAVLRWMLSIPITGAIIESQFMVRKAKNGFEWHEGLLYVVSSKL